MPKTGIDTFLAEFSEHDSGGSIDTIKAALALEQLSSCFDNSGSLHPIEDIIQWLDDQKAKNHIFIKREGLNTLREWDMDGNGYLSHKDKKFFRFVGIHITSQHREVASWSQPLMQNIGPGVIGLLIRRVNKKMSFLMQAKAEVGNRNVVLLAPTVQFTQENYINNEKLKSPFLFDEFLEPKKFLTIWENMFSEEGGKFYKAQNLHKILFLPEHIKLDLPPEYKWLSFSQLRFFLHMGEYVNYCARSILSCLV